MSTKTAAKTAGKAAVSAHPAFPAIVALWFAALLGLGSLVLPVALIERLSEGSGLPAYLAAAQPPLGFTARIAVALCAAIVGTVTGLAIARVISARNHVPDRASDEATAIETEVEAPAGPAKRPISALDELGEGGFDAAVPDEESTAVDEPLVLDSFDPALADEMPEAEDTIEPAPTACEESATIEHPAIEADPPAHAGETAGEVAIVDLVDRFARALQRHRDEAKTAQRAAPVRARPEAESVVGLAETLSQREETTHGQARFDPGADEDEHEDESDHSYPSLLTMKSPFGVPREPVRLDDRDDCDVGAASDEAAEPVAVFPAPADAAQSARHASKGEAETALRDALEKLQRMSGAA